MMLLGNIAILTQDYNTVLEWDGDDGEFSNLDEANELLHVPYKDGWSLE
jgi:hypothetical protein